MNKKFFDRFCVMFFEGAEGGGGGESVPSAAPAPASSVPVSDGKISKETSIPKPHSLFAESGEESQAPTPAAPSPAVQPQAPAPVAPQLVTLTPEQLRELTGNRNAPSGPAQPTPAPRLVPGSPEYKKLFNVVDITPETYKAFLGVDPEPGQVEALSSLKDAIVKQALTMASAHTKYVEQQLAERFSPVMQFYQAQQQKELEVDFFGKHKDLVPYKDLTATVARQLAANPQVMQGKTREQIFAVVATEVKRLLQTAGVQPGAAPANTPNPAKPASLAMGGGNAPAAPAGSVSGSKKQENPQAKFLFQ